MKISTSRFGEVEIAEEDLFSAVYPLPGFPESERYFFIERDKIKPFVWLQSANDAELTFVVVETSRFFHDYAPNFSRFDLEEVGAANQAEIRIFVIVVLPEDLTQMTANLKGPLIVNFKKKKFKQAFIETERWTVRESILEGIKRSEAARLEKERKEQKNQQARGK